MKKAILLLVFTTIIVISCNQSKSVNYQPMPVDNKADSAAAKTQPTNYKSDAEKDYKSDAEKIAILMKDEKSVKDYVFTDADVLYIAVYDDGTSRNGLAEYFCELLKENYINAFKVKIVKVNSMKDPEADNAYGVLLGESSCN